MRKSSPMISVVDRSMPSLPLHLRVCSLPSIYTCEPFFKYSPAISARLRYSTTRCHSVASRFSPLALSFQVGGRQRQMRDRVADGGVTYFRIVPEIADQR